MFSVGKSLVQSTVSFGITTICTAVGGLLGPVGSIVGTAVGVGLSIGISGEIDKLKKCIVLFFQKILEVYTNLGCLLQEDSIIGEILAKTILKK